MSRRIVIQLNMKTSQRPLCVMTVKMFHCACFCEDKDPSIVLACIILISGRSDLHNTKPGLRYSTISSFFSYLGSRQLYQVAHFYNY